MMNKEGIRIWVNIKSGKKWFGKTLKIDGRTELFVTDNPKTPPKRKVNIENYTPMSVELKSKETKSFSFNIIVRSYKIMRGTFQVSIRRDGTKTWKTFLLHPRDLITRLRKLNYWKVLKRNINRTYSLSGNTYVFKYITTDRFFELGE